MAKAKKLPSGSWRVLLYVGTDENGKKKRKSKKKHLKKAVFSPYPMFFKKKMG